MYSDCTGTSVSMHYCTSIDCTSGCITTPIPITSGCNGAGSKSVCSDKIDGWNEAGFTYHVEFHYGESTCTDSYSSWTADHNTCQQFDCIAEEGYAMEGFCSE